MKYIYFVFAGLISGVAGGMGMGGGTLLIPLLTLFGGVSQHTAQAVNLISFIPMAIVALIFHAKNKLVDTHGVLYMIIPGAVCAAIFAFVAKNADADVLKRVFGGFLIVLAGIQAFAEKIAKRGEN